MMTAKDPCGLLSVRKTDPHGRKIVSTTFYTVTSKCIKTMEGPVNDGYIPGKRQLKVSIT
jgi:hypothetical protein